MKPVIFFFIEGCTILMLIRSVQCYSFTTSGSTDNNNTFYVGTNATFVCENNKQPINVRFAVNGTAVIDCLIDSCQNISELPENYHFTTDFKNGRIELLIDDVTYKEAATNFTCDSYPSSTTITPIIIDKIVSGSDLKIAAVPLFLGSLSLCLLIFWSR